MISLKTEKWLIKLKESSQTVFTQKSINILACMDHFGGKVQVMLDIAYDSVVTHLCKEI